MVIFFLNNKLICIYINILIGKEKYLLRGKKNIGSKILQKKCVRTEKSAHGHIKEL
jgi:hypothetical protein